MLLHFLLLQKPPLPNGKGLKEYFSSFSLFYFLYLIVLAFTLSKRWKNTFTSYVYPLPLRFLLTNIHSTPLYHHNHINSKILTIEVHSNAVLIIFFLFLFFCFFLILVVTFWRVACMLIHVCNKHGWNKEFFIKKI